MTNTDWQGKPYYSLDAYFKNKYGKKCYKIAVDAGCTCPNRDGKLDTRGCIFCSAGGSGDFAVPFAKMNKISGNSALSSDGTSNANGNSTLSPDEPGNANGNVSVSMKKLCNDDMSKYIEQCITEGAAKFTKRVSDNFVIYFQAFTNTYGDMEYLKALWRAALANESVVGISIATRPDCLEEDVMTALEETKMYADFLNKFVWLELGLQTIHEQSEKYIRRHYPLSVYDEACKKLESLKIPYIVHIILGLPGESTDMMMETVRYVCTGKDNAEVPFGIKLQLLHVLKHTDLAVDYVTGKFEVLSMETYIELVCDLVELIPQNVVIHRITGDGPKNILIAPAWSGNKKLVLNSLHKRMKERGIMQGGKNYGL